ncbi:GTP-binding protein RAD [Bemisia tabaci]|uniref:GTP-binding protein RAD n=1 Tax=Bemisia tabaci TaxID=7038 RepID=UPI003B286EFA
MGLYYPFDCWLVNLWAEIPEGRVVHNHVFDDDEWNETAVSVLLDGEESELIFIDHPATDVTPEECIDSYEPPHAYCVVYSTADRSSFTVADECLQALWKKNSIKSKAVIVVGNKTDLVRSRVVTTEEGKAMAIKYDCKFIETSVGINHNVDELLVGILSQIRLKLDMPPDAGAGEREAPYRRRSRSPMGLGCGFRKYGSGRLSASLKVKGLLSKVWARDSKSKSCENLHVL